MPTYLLHGFRWLRHSIRIHIILNDLEDAAAEWILAPITSLTLLNSFYTKFDFLPPSRLPPHILPPKARTQDSPPETKTVSNGEGTTHVGRNGIADERAAGFRKTLKKMSSTKLLRKSAKAAEERAIAEDSRQRSSTATTISTNASLSASEEQRVDLAQVAFNNWSVVKLLEQYEPEDVDLVSQPYAYVADYMVKVHLGVSIAEETARYEALMAKQNKTPWIDKLRDGLEKDEKVGWFVVVCGDEERAPPSDADDDASEASMDSQETASATPSRKGFGRFFSRKNTKEK